MCGRVIRITPCELLREMFDLAWGPDALADRFNLAPTDLIPVIRRPRQLEMLRWGLTMPEKRMAGVNARLESLKGSLYRDKVRSQRCLVVTDGFYEWRKVGDKKYPFLIRREDRAPTVMAGIHDGSGCAIITKPAAGIVATLHDRMPVVLERHQFSAWLDAEIEDVSGILSAATADGLTCYPVSRDVNNVANDDVRLIERAPEPGTEAPKGKTLSLF